MDGKPVASLASVRREARHLSAIAARLAKEAATAGRRAEGRRYLVVADLLGRIAGEPGELWLLAEQTRLDLSKTQS